MKRSYARCLILLAAVLSFASTVVIAQTPTRVTPMTPDVVEKYDQTLSSADYVRREVMVPMRDGVKLFTVVVMK
jgi:predicted acyl esterase